MKTSSRTLVSIGLSTLIAAVIVVAVFFILKDMSREVERGRLFDQVINKTHALNLLVARYSGEPDRGYIRQVTETRKSLEDLLSRMASLSESEELLIRHIRSSSQDLGYSVDKLTSATGKENDGLEAERRKVIVSQLLMKSQFIFDDTYRLTEISQFRLEAAQARAISLILVLIVLLIGANAGISFVSGMSIARAEAETQKQREWLHVTLSSIGDAVLATDAAGNVTFLNPVAAELTGWSQKESSGQPVQSVFRIVNEKTRMAAENIVERVLREGTIVNLANHTALISRDGIEVPIEDSAAPIRDGSGNVIGVVLVFHDVTEKRRALDKLRESQARLDLALRSAQMGVWHLDIAEDKRVFDNQVCHILGIDAPNFTGMPEEFFNAVHPDDHERVVAALARTVEHGAPYEAEYRSLWPDGTIHYVASRGSLLTDDQGQPVRLNGLIWDVTESKQAEDALRKSEARFKLLSDTAGRLLALDNPQEIVNELSRNVMAHLDCQAFFNFLVEESLGKLRLNAYSGIPEEEARKIEWLDFGVAVCGCAARDGERIIAEDILSHPDIRTELVRSYGIQAYACHPLKIAGQVIGTLSFGTKTRTSFSPHELELMKTVADQVAIGMERVRLVEGLRSSRDELELRVRERTRAYRTLSECNQAVVRHTQEMELLREVCRIAVDVGGYRMAWVGFAENDEDKSVRPVASAGYDEGYLGQAKISWADSEKGKGPTGIAIRTGKIIASQNALLDPAYAPWLLEGTKRGYAASIALPLTIDQNVIGALTIYASEPDAFDEAEANLLRSLAENLSYGIASIRVAEQRRRSEKELRAYTSRLELVNQELQEFAFIASHDLQEPLRKIQSFGNMLRTRCSAEISEQGKDYLVRMENSATRMRQLIQDLLQFSRVATKPEPYKPVSLKEAVSDVIQLFEERIAREGATVDLADLPVIEADESQMRQLFQNLIGNALKYRKESESPRVRLYSKNGENSCEILVEDNGIGFEEQYVGKIFAPFQRLHSQGSYEGTGMGLAICRKIVERHGGSITARSVPGKGSTFIVKLPIRHT